MSPRRTVPAIAADAENGWASEPSSIFACRQLAAVNSVAAIIRRICTCCVARAMVVSSLCAGDGRPREGP